MLSGPYSILALELDPLGEALALAGDEHEDKSYQPMLDVNLGRALQTSVWLSCDASVYF